MSKKNMIPESDTAMVENNEVTAVAAPVEHTVDADMIQHISDAIKDAGLEPEKVPSLKAFSLALGVTVTKLNNTAKVPVPGQVYDPTVTNWDALNEYFKMKLKDVACPIKSMGELVQIAIEKQEWLDQSAVRRTGSTAGSNLIDVDGGKMPRRKADMFEMGGEHESLICFKKDAGVYKMVYQTAGYTCVRAVDEDGNFTQELVRVVSNGTLNTKCVSPSEMANAIADRWSGEYQKRHLYDKDVFGMEHPEKPEGEAEAAPATEETAAE